MGAAGVFGDSLETDMNDYYDCDQTGGDVVDTILALTFAVGCVALVALIGWVSA